jgi:methionine biosynthesis protein MetW
MVQPAGGKDGAAALNGARDRAFDETIVSLVAPGSRVIDLGCGTGDLLAKLKKSKGIRDVGVESSGPAAAACIARGLNVLQGRMEEEVRSFGPASFDVAILNQVLTLVRDPLGLLEEGLRAARRVIVTFPNFTHWRVRIQLLRHGCLPVTPSLPYQWHDTPHVRYVSVDDFRRTCGERGWRITREEFMHQSHGGSYRTVGALPALRASLALFQLGKES